MRNRVKICGEYFDVSLVEGGKLRATSETLPGFELIEASHSMLRLRMQKALASYDSAQLLKPAEQNANPNVSTGPQSWNTPRIIQGSPYPPAPPYLPANAIAPIHLPFTGFIDVRDQVYKIIVGVPTLLKQCISLPQSLSHHGLQYNKIGYISLGKQSLLNAFQSFMWQAESHGATDIVWRTCPVIENTVGGADLAISARLHFLPQHVNSQIAWVQPGDPYIKV